MSDDDSDDASTEMCDQCLDNVAMTTVSLDDGTEEALCAACGREREVEVAARRDGTIEFRLVSKLHYDNLVHVWIDAPYRDYHALLASTPGSVDDAGLRVLVVKLLLFEDKHLQVLSALLMHEVQAADSEQLLFAEASVGVRLVATCLALLADDYVRLTLGPLVRDLVANPHGYEVDAARLAPTDSLAANRDRLVALAQRAFGAIADSLDACPLDVRMLLASIQSIVDMRFEGGGKSAVQSFVFLRLFCPAVASPKQHGLVAEEPSPEARRALVLLSKIMQNSARGVASGDVSTSSMRDLDVPLSRGNQRALADFFAAITRGRVDDHTPATDAHKWSRAPLKAVDSVTVMSELLQRVNLHFGFKRKKGEKIDYFTDLFDLLNSDQPLLDGKFVRLAGGHS
jgi:hypothetical protein